VSALTRLVARIAYPFLRIAMSIVLVWIGSLKFFNPASIVGLLGASPFAFLASPGFAYLLGASEIVAGIMLLAGFRVRYVSIVTMALFVGTLAIFVLTPKLAYGETGFPVLSLLGELLLKDVVLLAASATLVAMAHAREIVSVTPAQPSGA
jgi:uncharacterized membrane protein YkgB